MIIVNDIFKKPGDPFYSERDFEKLYIASRKKENRLYTDEQVAQLPFIASSHIHHAEWKIRKRSSTRLIDYLKGKKGSLSILEVGCGNGWLSGRLAGIKNSYITAIDINKTELNQGKRVFKDKLNLTFKEGEMDGMDYDKDVDIVIFAASIQYFPSFRKVIEDALSLLKRTGEIHILDSCFYTEFEVVPARRRSDLYYRSIGCDTMADFYFHHNADALNDFNHTFLFNPSSFTNKIFSRRDTFPWILIKPS